MCEAYLLGRLVAGLGGMGLETLWKSVHDGVAAFVTHLTALFTELTVLVI